VLAAETVAVPHLADSEVTSYDATNVALAEA